MVPNFWEEKGVGKIRGEALSGAVRCWKHNHKSSNNNKTFTPYVG